MRSAQTEGCMERVVDTGSWKRYLQRSSSQLPAGRAVLSSEVR